MIVLLIKGTRNVSGTIKLLTTLSGWSVSTPIFKYLTIPKIMVKLKKL